MEVDPGVWTSNNHHDEILALVQALVSCDHSAPAPVTAIEVEVGRGFVGPGLTDRGFEEMLVLLDPFGKVDWWGQHRTARFKSETETKVEREGDKNVRF